MAPCCGPRPSCCAHCRQGLGNAGARAYAGAVELIGKRTYWGSAKGCWLQWGTRAPNHPNLCSRHGLTCYSSLPLPPPHLASLPSMQRVLTIGQLALLAPVGPAAPACRPLCVVNTHLFFHPRAGHIRAMHTWVLMQVSRGARGGVDTLISWRRLPMQQAAQQLIIAAPRPSALPCRGAAGSGGLHARGGGRPCAGRGTGRPGSHAALLRRPEQFPE